MRRACRSGAVLAMGLALIGLASSLVAEDFNTWILRAGVLRSSHRSADDPLPVGSLQKPFIVKAWASSHPTAASPRFTCTRTSGCWRPGGHGALDLRSAIRESCNTYFRHLARETPTDALAASFRAAGFAWAGGMTEAEAIGLPGLASVKVTPRALLADYSELARVPWAAREDIRQELLAGLRDAANEGTASGLGVRGLMAKTGTVPALDGTPLRTSGYALVMDDAGFAFLGLLDRGTGREAAVRAGRDIESLRPGSIARTESAGPTASSKRARPRSAPRRQLDDPVRVALLDELPGREIRLRNAGATPIDSSRGFVGPGALVTPAPGDRFASGLWRLDVERPRFERTVRAALGFAPTDGPPQPIATMSARDYATGVLRAELAGPAPDLRVSLAAAVLRFLRRGPRHADADVCDSTHCAWFVGEGPVPRWLRPETAITDATIAPALGDDEWSRALATARDQPTGLDQWTADCGGDPVSAHFIWGGGDRRVVACSRHPKGSGRSWRRDWPTADVDAVFGAPVRAMDVTVVDGQWFLRVRVEPRRPGEAAPSTLSLPYDDAHRRLAARLGWDAMPAPASRVMRTPRGFVAEGVGSGHRVGLCLGR